MSSKCFVYLKHQKLSIVKIIIIGLVFIALLSVLRAFFFHAEIKNSIVADLKRETRLLADHAFSLNQEHQRRCKEYGIDLSQNLHLSSLTVSSRLSDILTSHNHNLYVKYVATKPLNDYAKADAEESRLIDYFSGDKDKLEYFGEYHYKDEIVYQYAMPVRADVMSLACDNKKINIGYLEGIISVRVAQKSAFKKLYSLFMKEIIFSLLSIFFVISLLLFLYKNTKEKMNALDNEANKYAFTDALTGLYNRHYLNHFLEKFVPIQKVDNYFAVLFIDIDNFKNVNDEYGHIVGDCVLTEIGKKLLSLTRDQDVLCRYGGEEFVIIFSDITKEFAINKAENLRIDIEEMELNCKMQKITASIGISCGKSFDNINTIIEQADKALYRAKMAGKNCTELF